MVDVMYHLSTALEPEILSLFQKSLNAVLASL